VHWYRNIFSHVPSAKVREIAAMLKAIHASEDLAAAREKANRVSTSRSSALNLAVAYASGTQIGT
jgi:transposase-like protein